MDIKDESDPRFKYKYKKVMTLGELLPLNMDLLLRNEDARSMLALKVVSAWHEMLGVLADYSSHEDYNNGELHVRITSAPLRNDLFYQKSELIKKLNAKLGKNIVTKIVFH